VNTFAIVLVVLSAGIAVMLGAIHLAYTFRGPLLAPRDPALRAHMNEVSPVISKETTMWRCWIGFNSTHSLSLLLFGVVFGFLALTNSLFQSPFLVVVGAVTLGAFVAISRAYFFSIPFACIAISLALYVASIALNVIPH
jgi:hypothetical protein